MLAIGSNSLFRFYFVSIAVLAEISKSHFLLEQDPAIFIGQSNQSINQSINQSVRVFEFGRVARWTVRFGNVGGGPFSSCLLHRMTFHVAKVASNQSNQEVGSKTGKKPTVEIFGVAHLIVAALAGFPPVPQWGQHFGFHYNTLTLGWIGP